MFPSLPPARSGWAHATTQADPADGAPAQRAPLRFGLAYGRLMYRLRWSVLVLWLAALAVSVPFALRASSALRGGGYALSHAESSRVAEQLQQELQVPPSQVLLVLQSATTPISQQAYQQEIDDILRSARTAPHVIGVQPGQTSSDERTTYVVVDYDADDGTADQYVPALRSALEPVTGPARIYVSGTPATYADYSIIAQQDLQRAEAVTLPIVLVVLLLIFGTLVAGAMPLALALTAVSLALAVIDGIATQTWMSIFVLNVVTTIGMGISIDYSLLMTRRFREELGQGKTVQEAVAWTAATTGEAILFSGLTVMVGFTGLLLTGIPITASFGVSGVVVVGSALLAALTLLPALFAILGERVNGLRVPGVGRRVVVRADTQRPVGGSRASFWQRWAEGVMRYPVVILLAVVVLLVIAGLPIFALNAAAYGSSPLPPTAESEQGFAILRTTFPQLIQAPVVLATQSLDGSSMLTQENLQRVDALTRWVAAQPHVTAVASLMRPPAQPGDPPLSAEQLMRLYTSGAYAEQPALAHYVATVTHGDFTILTVRTDAPLDSPAGKELIAHLRAGAAATASGFTVQVGGLQAVSVDFTSALYGTFPWTLAFILGTTFLLLLLLFRSLVLPLKAVTVNLLSLSVSFGVLVAGFQQGRLSQALHFTGNGTVDAIMPIVIFCILFGLSMDYEVFLLTRIREEWLRTRNNRLAVAHGLEKTAGVITSAALLFALVIGPLIFSTLLVTKEFGAGMLVAVLVDATIIRLLLVPATMRLLGRWNWWLPGATLPADASPTQHHLRRKKTVQPSRPV